MQQGLHLAFHQHAPLQASWVRCSSEFAIASHRIVRLPTCVQPDYPFVLLHLLPILLSFLRLSGS